MKSSEILAAGLEGGRAKQLSDSEAEKRVQWVKGMRKVLSPPEMINADGSVNQDFFKPKKVVLVEDRKWGAEERELLYKGLEKYGVGRWGEISAQLLPRWDDQTLRVKASKLLGSQSLARYVGWRGDRAAVDREFERNKALGERLGCWKGSYLVEDDAGSVRRTLQELKSASEQSLNIAPVALGEPADSAVMD